MAEKDTPPGAVSPAELTDNVTVDVNDTTVQRIGDDLTGLQNENLPETPKRPADGATKAKWVEYAVSVGLNPDVAEAHTKAAIVAWVDGEPLPLLDRPDDAASKQVWADHAKAHGLPLSVSRGWTKTRIIDWLDG